MAHLVVPTVSTSPLHMGIGTRSRMRSFNNFPTQFHRRVNSNTFVFKGNTAALNGTMVMEGVACRRRSPYERMNSDCQWAYNPVDATVDQVKVRGTFLVGTVRHRADRGRG